MSCIDRRFVLVAAVIEQLLSAVEQSLIRGRNAVQPLNPRFDVADCIRKDIDVQRYAGIMLHNRQS